MPDSYLLFVFVGENTLYTQLVVLSVHKRIHLQLNAESIILKVRY